MPNIESDILSIVSAVAADKASAEIVAAIHSKYRELQDTKTQCIRAKKTALIRLKAKFDTCLLKFENEYKRLKARNITVPEVERYIADMKGYSDRLSIEKNRKN